MMGLGDFKLMDVCVCLVQIIRTLRQAQGTRSLSLLKGTGFMCLDIIYSAISLM